MSTLPLKNCYQNCLFLMLYKLLIKYFIKIINVSFIRGLNLILTFMRLINICNFCKNIYIYIFEAFM